MADLDAELLALAGGDDSSDEETSTPHQTKPTISSPPSSEDGPSSPQRDSKQDEEMARKGVAKRVKRAKASRKEIAEEGELSSAESENSMQSAPMSESESEGEASADGDEGPIFPYEKYFESAQDKDDIMALPEIQREQILSERALQVDRHNQDIALRRLLASREREEARHQAKKRKAGAADLEDNKRKSSRQKTTLGGRKVGEASDAIEAYKRQREQKGKRDELRRREPTARKRDRRSSSRDGEFSDADADGESDVEWENGKPARSASPPKRDVPVELKDLNRARVGRSNFAQVCFYPKFDERIANCYVRLNVGLGPEGQNVYRIGVIKRFAEGKPYAMEGPNGRSFVTSQYALLAHGKAEKEFPFIACSDSPFTEGEFNRWRQTLTVEGLKMPTKSVVAAKVSDINRLINHRFTDQELNDKLRKQGAYDTKGAVFQRIHLEKSRKVAVEAGDEAEIARIDAELAAFTGPAKLAFGTSLYKPKSTQQTQQERLEEINRRNQKLNTENVRRAQLEERKAARKAAEAVARGEATLDPFARVKTRAKVYHDVQEKSTAAKSGADDVFGDDNAAVTPKPEAKTLDTKSSTPKFADAATTKKAGGIARIRHRNMDDENIAALDLGIEIDI